MKRTLLLPVVILVLASTLSAADIKIAYINSERIRTEYGAFADAQAQFDKEVTEWESEAAELENEIIDLRTELQQQSLLLSEDKKMERQRLIEQKQGEYQRYLAEIFGTGGKAEARNAELTMPLLEIINEAIISIAESEGYDLILDVAGGNIAYIDENLDITDQLLGELESTPTK